MHIPAWSLNAVNGCIVDQSSISAAINPIAGKVFTERDETAPDMADDAADCRRLPEIVLYEHANWGGANTRTALNFMYVGKWWDERISSIIVLGGLWRLYEHRDFKGKSWNYKAGYYSQIPGDIVSSFKLISFC